MIEIIDYKVKELKETLEKHISDYTNQLELLSNLEVVTKKDGSEYVNLVKGFKLIDGSNFTDLRVYRDGDGDYDYEISATTKGLVNVRVNICGYENLTYNYAKNEYTIPEGVSEDRVHRGSWRIPYYALNTKELNKRIEDMYNAICHWREVDKTKLDNINAMVEILKNTAEQLNALGGLPYGWQDCIR